MTRLVPLQQRVESVWRSLPLPTTRDVLGLNRNCQIGVGRASFRGGGAPVQDIADDANEKYEGKGHNNLMSTLKVLIQYNINHFTCNL